MKCIIILLIIVAIMNIAVPPAAAVIGPAKVETLDLLWWLRGAGWPWMREVIEWIHGDGGGIEIPWGSGSDGWC